MRFVLSHHTSHVNMSTRNHSTTTKSWRSDAPIILPGWECHTGGSWSKPTAHQCSQSGRRLWVAHHKPASYAHSADVPDVSNEERNDDGTLHQKHCDNASRNSARTRWSATARCRWSRTFSVAAECQNPTRNSQ